VLLWPPCIADADAIFCSYGYYLFSFLPSPILSGPWSEIECLPYFHTWCGLSANLECMSEMCCTRLAENTGRKKSPSVHHRTTLSGYIFAMKAHIDNWKKLVKQQYLLHMSSQYGELPLTNGWDNSWWVCSTSANFNRVCVLVSLLHRRCSTEVNQQRSAKLCTMFGHLLCWYTMYTFLFNVHTFFHTPLTQFCQVHHVGHRPTF